MIVMREWPRLLISLASPTEWVPRPSRSLRRAGHGNACACGAGGPLKPAFGLSGETLKLAGWPGFQTPEATIDAGAPSFAKAKGGYDDAIHNGWCRTERSCAGSIAAHPCKKRKGWGTLRGNGAMQRWATRHLKKVHTYPVLLTNR
jgi:hypothetical protein